MTEEIKEGRARSNRRGDNKDYGSPLKIAVEPTAQSIEQIGCFDSPYGKRIDYETRLEVQEGYDLKNGGQNAVRPRQ